ncbi:autotransporter-associated beta strand repeat-containing protein [Roseimicrobium sp. ORNL1]|uniref:beta strand repeat-containing protein n=1 Tax=Roseimicrobium sp. ORNL1 TaxID=2711231 RepID=UPI0013E18494|nr:autotransporter-associated beta strand repeat-containing protein [Roseimicrobium sp. ORNL1]QIF03985.1 PEP-CTERM sorting domain-containing protein [Roseimicrobium sp. ORNL1]
MLALTSVVVQAQSVWSTGDATWSDPASWNSATLPVSADYTRLQFGGSSSYTATNNLGDFTLNKLVFNPTAGTVTVAGDTANQLIFARSSFAELPTLTHTGAGTVTISAPIVYSGNTTVTNAGSGSLILSGNQIYTNGTKQTFINAGTGVFTLPLIDGNQYAETAGSFAGTGVVLNFINNNTAPSSFNIGDLTSVGNMTLNIGGTGTVRFAGASGGLFDGAGVLNVLAGATFDFNGNGESMGAISGAGTININGGVNMDGADGVFEFSGTLTGSSSATVAVSKAAHTLVLSGSTSNYTGATTINGGRTIVNANAPNGSTGGSGALGNATSEVLVGNTSGALNAALLIGKGGVTIGRNIRLRSGNTGVATLGGLNDSGTVTYSGNVFLGSNGTASVAAVAKGLTIQTTKGGTVAFTGNLLRATSFASGDTDTLTVTGGGTAILKGSNTFTGATTVSGGKLVLDYTANNTSKLSQTASLTLNGGSLEVVGSNADVTFQTVGGLVVGNGTGVRGGGGRITVTSGANQSVVLTLGTITRNTGATIDFATVNTGSGTAIIFASAANNSAGILGSYATYNRSDWAVVDGSASITELSAASYSSSFGAGLHTSLAGNTALAAGGATSNTLRITGAAAVTFAAAADTLTLQNGGLLVTPTAGATSIGTTSVRGNLASSTGEIIIHQNSTAGALTVHSVISGTTTLTKDGDGTLILTGTNTHTGGTYINGGTVQVTTSANFGANASEVFINNATLIVAAATGVTNVLGTHLITIGSAGATIEITGENQSVGNGAFRGSGTLTKTGTGSISFGTALNPFTGNIVINQGQIIMNSEQLNNAGLITVNNGGSYTITDDTSSTFQDASTTNPDGRRIVINGDGYNNLGAIRLTDQTADDVSIDPRITLNREIVLQTTSRIEVVNGTDTGSFSQLTFGGNVTGPGGLVKTGNGGLVLTARDNTYSGATEVRNGILAISSGNDRLPTGTTVTLGTASTSTSGVLRLNGYSQIIAGLATTGSGTANAVVGGSAASTSRLEVKVASGSQTYAGSLGGTGTTFQAGNNHADNNLDFVKSGAGSLTLTKASTYSGSTIVQEGKLLLGNAQALGGTGASYTNGKGGTAVENGATLDLNGQENVQEVITLNGHGAGGGGALVNNNIGTTASLGSGVASLSFSTAASTGWAAGTSITIAPPTSETGMSAAATGSFGLSSASITITNGGAGFDLNDANITITGGGGSGAVLQPVFGLTTAALTVTSGTTTYSVAPTVVLPNGATGVANLDASGKVVSITVTNPGTGFRGALSAAQQTAIFSGGTVLSQGTNPTVVSNDTNFIIVGVTVINPGTGYTSAPTIAIAGSSPGTATAVANAQNFVLNGFTLADSGSGYESAPTVTITNPDGTAAATATANLTSVVLASDSSVGGAGNLILNPVISGEHGLTKVGAGTTTLAGNNLYTGNTTVSEGTLLAANIKGSASGSGNVTVQSGATLGGSGYIGKAAGSAASPASNTSITVSSGAKLMVGDSHNRPFFLSATPAKLTLQTGGDGITSGIISLLGTVQLDIFDKYTEGEDPIYFNDSLVLNSANQVVIGGTLEVRDTTGMSGLTWGVGDFWQLFDWSGVIPGINYSGGFQNFVLPDLATGLKWDTSEIYTTGVISVAVIPEPGRMMLLALAFSAAVLRRRRTR